jgi:hypothetical protein
MHPIGQKISFRSVAFIILFLRGFVKMRKRNNEMNNRTEESENIDKI